MINQFLKDAADIQAIDVAGIEALGFGEKISLFFNEASLKYDKAFGALRSSAHTVKIDPAAYAVKQNNPNFFKLQHEDIAVPAFFQAGKDSWVEYCQAVNLTPALISVMLTETSRFYDWLKEIAAKGRVGRSYHFSIQSTNKLLIDVENFIGTLKEHRSAKAAIGELYESFTQVFDEAQKFNAAVSLSKSRDIELLAKSLNQVSRIGNLIAEKVKASELILSEEDLAKMQNQFKDFVRYANYTGAMIGLMNEQTRIFEEQLDEVKKLK